MRTARLGLLGALLVGIVPLVTSAPAPAADVVPISETEALKVVDQYNQANEHNNAALDVESQDKIELAPIKTIDDATFREYQGRGQTTLGENSTIDQIRVYVPDQSSYPRMFLESERLSSPQLQQPERQFLLFVQQQESDPWRVSMAVQIVDTSLPKVAEDKFGLATLVSGRAASRLKVKPSSLSPKLAKYWSKVSQDSTATSKTFNQGSLADQGPQLLYVNSLNQLPLGGDANVDFKFSRSETQPTCFARSGGALCFFVVEVHETLKPTSGAFTQPPTREALTGLITPGTYSQVDFDHLAIMMASVPNKSPNFKVDVIGVYDGLVRAEGTSSAGGPGIES